MPSEWLGVHGGRSYVPVPRGSSLPSPAVLYIRTDVDFDVVLILILLC